MKKTTKRNIVQWIKAFSLALITVVIIKSIFFWVYVVPSSSMEKTLLPGDIIFVNKLSYGIRLPITPITFPLSHQKMPFSEELNSFTDIIQLPYLRIFSSKIKRHDIVVFNYPMETEYPVDHRSFYIKRCLGLPGEEIKVYSQNIFINDSLVTDSIDLSFDYKVKSVIPLTIDTLLKYGITEGGKIDNKGWWQLTLSHTSKKKLAGLSYIKDIKPLNINENQYSDYVFPHNENFKWNLDFFGSLKIPQKGLTVKLSKNNIHIYERVIKEYEENEMEMLEDAILINNDTVSSYTFKMDYYFVMGDNRHNSSDSRFWGFVPENHIIGKATLVLFSVNKSSNAINRYRWDRIFTKLN